MRIWTVLSLTVVLAEDEESCVWCGAGACEETGAAMIRGSFVTSVTRKLDRSFAYWRPVGQVALGEPTTVRTALIIQHGASRNGEEYTRWAAAKVKDVLVYGPQIYYHNDDGVDGHLFWDSKKTAERDWRWGGDTSASLPYAISTFRILDEIVDTLMQMGVQRVIVVGHSAGAQLMQRYALLSNYSHPSTSFFVANPSSVTYLDARRPVLPALSCDSCCNNASIASATYLFDFPKSCTGYNDYGFGLDGVLPPYVVDFHLGATIERYVNRDVRIFSGESDVCVSDFQVANHCLEDSCVPNDHLLDDSCQANAQGYVRMMRAHAFIQYTRRLFGASHTLISIPGVGHNGCAMLQDPRFVDAILLSGRDDEVSVVVE